MESPRIGTRAGNAATAPHSYLRIITLKLNDGNDANDGESRSETYASLVRENGDDDSAPLLPDLPSQPSYPSQFEFTEEDDDE